MLRFDSEEVIKRLEGCKVPCGRVNDLRSMFEGQIAKELGLVCQVGGSKFVRSPVRTNKENMAEMTVPPDLNEHQH